ncbi:protein-export membrane protein SecF [Candidatus Roizmanbacteria bacterium RIFCSPLOWO2_01_FULL_40_42]|uniref:Protein-export membrane protein SecF n=1 Tax=Candidatus Roizmanbacteria bacterium RIFCSPLOWO2_01_FULL_40_42 TaxID=1802066 RepID=A0A1F7J4Y3_9BACT|nr:MAG: protein-export membrane protein SecF [Candidatus Roizmanbacteria bacterium RIFCSPHIGHO2_02_FULL_40_53]OGK36312.1 MAG: protein-export membrane protein SecF [Candidatus Roizmanbacteria bacterium RIFCSPHIGHO2_12_FULL_40_130]OGK50684.1 MAG: protein-export membrane protein SecF [Candidatus Roizmanbacteria bacterium RIFCSPLOWO2_01_FULL_40_42]OGK59213.1 MAG: protein-export membrane protein SecF [Candidatus Roizmanbacteria bacterium RIFCSPLOWO2_02_FULL_40_13]
MINFLKYRWLYFAISAIVIGAGILSMARFGFRYSIDFVGGTTLEYRVNKSVSENTLGSFLQKEGVEIVDLETIEGKIGLRTKALDEKQESALRKNLQKDLGLKTELLRFETVGPVLGRETMYKTITAAIVAVIAILLYMSFSFKGVNFALSAILALLHDFLVVVGTYSLLSYFFKAEVDTLFVTALLTTMSFSVHDTIVVFDKIREYKKTEGRGNVEEYANRALTETFVRSINNSMTIVFMLLALILLGGSTIRFFIVALLIGTITGTYSSPFIATPILVWLEKRKR